MNHTTSRLRDLFETALSLPPNARASYLSEHCAEPRQRELLDAMLAADADISDHLLDGSYDALYEQIGEGDRGDTQPPSSIGPFVLHEKLGEGGSSIVFRAEREQAGVKQVVALKLLRRGLYSDEEKRRFRRERFALTQLRHPGIARLIEGGLTENGIPYIALELVNGEPITEYARDKGLDLRKRLQLFVHACRAVEAAHRALIVHRDLKPSNVLVTAEGDVKLLDFGIAKLLDDEIDGDATRTQYHAMTPAYAAPEQFSHDAITTATDVYALGVLLAELITGRRRAPGEQRTPSSQINGKNAVDDSVPKIPATRRQLRGDLDNIVMKATAEIPELRYASAGALAEEVERHLAGQAILAHPPSRWYRTSKFVTRHKGGVMTTVAFLLAVFVALGVALWQANVARRQAQRADAVQTFLVDVFQSNSSNQKDPVKARATTASELLALGAKKIDSTMVDAPEAKLQMLLLLGDMHNDLGLDEKAAQLYRKATDLARTVYGEDSIEAFDARMKLADTLHSSNSDADVESVLKAAQLSLDRNHDDNALRRARLADQFAQYYATRDLPTALRDARSAVELYERAHATDHLSSALSRMARIEHNSGLDSDAVASYLRTIEISRSVGGDNNPDLPRYYAELAEIQVTHHDIVEGERNARNALQVAKAINGENHVDVVQCEMRLGRLLADTGRLKEGMELLQSAKQKVLALVGPDDGFHTPQVLYQNGTLLIRDGRIEEGLTDVESAVENRRRNRPGTIALAQFLAVAASAEIEMGRFADANHDLEETKAILEKAGQKSPSASFDGYVSPRIRLALATGEYEDAERLASQLYTDASGKDALDLEEIYNELTKAEIESANHNETDAIEHASTVREKIQNSALANYYQPLVSRASFIEGVAAFRNGDVTTAIPLIQRALQERQHDLDEKSPKIAEAQIALAECYVANRDFAKAKTLVDSASAILATHTEVGPQYRQALQHVSMKLTSRADKSSS